MSKKILLFIMTLSPLMVSAYTEIDGIKYDLNADDFTASVGT